MIKFILYNFPLIFVIVYLMCYTISHVITKTNIINKQLLILKVVITILFGIVILCIFIETFIYIYNLNAFWSPGKLNSEYYPLGDFDDIIKNHKPKDYVVDILYGFVYNTTFSNFTETLNYIFHLARYEGDVPIHMLLFEHASDVDAMIIEESFSITYYPKYIIVGCCCDSGYWVCKSHPCNTGNCYLCYHISFLFFQFLLKFLIYLPSELLQNPFF